ncbi:DEAD/DEAH box helicase [Allorhizobium sp. BGMRC 0089]|uniref:DEAD/DEAH box helicase n=1 Tax=Allorhizobium sonneratiae TaxID=2934936 RepID=UPI00203492F3|nr:DEAD/DEAH box helicase [Allorhizobium sonneratiae]MCM2294232.1 DEAD/DEAH box helicase [Allorhizobium sonneratiae]
MTDLDRIVPAIAEALRKRGYTTLTPVQQAMLDDELAGRDALVSAQTGSGKTVAFGLAMAPTLLHEAERFARAAAPKALVIAPTRELALQVMRELEWLYELTGAVIASCVGGMDIRTERRALERGAHIVVGTPGRLRDHITRGALDLSGIAAVVLDEADEMLDLGFRDDLEFILENSPDERRTLLFSATVPRAIADLAKSYQRDAKRIETITEKKQHGDIDYRAMLVSPSDKEHAIINVLRYYEARNAIVFCSTRANVNHLTARLHNRGFSVVALSGELSQNERTHALQAMRDGRARVCIATDVAARGIDLPGLELVIHADLPSNGETLLHRSGRTGRAGNKGVSALIVPLNQRRKAERLLGDAHLKAEWALPPSADAVLARDDERLLNDAVFAEAAHDDESDMVARLIEAHGAEKLAAAFIRNYRASRSAPEDLIEISLEADKRPRRERSDEAGPRSSGESRGPFGPSRWFSLSVGRKQNAEPRWLIPMLCRHGDMTRHAIGAIRMQPEETFVEIAENDAERFLSALGPNKVLEKGIRVQPLPGAPDLSAPPRERKPRDYGKRDHEKRDYDRPRDRDRQGDFSARSNEGSKKPYKGSPKAAGKDASLTGMDADVWGLPKSQKSGQSKPDWRDRKQDRSPPSRKPSKGKKDDR